MDHKMGKKKSTSGSAGVPQPLAGELTKHPQTQGRSIICQTVSGKSEAALILQTVSGEFGECTRPRYSLRASSDRVDRPSSARSAMFVVTTTPERPAKLRRSGIRGGPPTTSGSVWANSNTCRSYGAWAGSALLAIDMALLTELSISPPPRRRSARNACEAQMLTQCATRGTGRTTNPPRLPLDRRTRAGALFPGRISA